MILMLQIEVLKSLELIPRTPSPTPLEERPVEELSTAELAELVGRYRVSLLVPIKTNYTDTYAGKGR